MSLYVSSSVLYMVRRNDIHLAKRLQYAALSLMGPSSSSRIGSHIGRDMVLGSSVGGDSRRNSKPPSRVSEPSHVLNNLLGP